MAEAGQAQAVVEAVEEWKDDSLYLLLPDDTDILLGVLDRVGDSLRRDPFPMELGK